MSESRADEDKKARERRQLDAFLELCDDVSDDLRVVPGESPDFILELPDGRIGVELRTLADEDLAKGSSFTGRLEQELAARLEQLLDDGMRAHVHVGFYEGGPARATRGWAEDTATKFVSLVEQQSAEGVERRRYGREELEQHGIELVRDAGIYLGGDVAVSIGHTAMGRKAPFVAAAVRDKEELVESYRQALPAGAEIWLLLVAGTRFADGVDQMVVEDQEFETDFDRVYFLDGYNGVVLRVDGSRGK